MESAFGGVRLRTHVGRRARRHDSPEKIEASIGAKWLLFERKSFSIAVLKDAWAAFRDVGAVHERLMPGRVVDTRLEGDARVLTLENDQEIRELIVDVDDEACRLAYAVVAGGRMPITYYHASFHVVAEGPGRSRVVWITDVLPHSLAAQVRVRIEGAAEAMNRTLEAQATPA